MTIDLAKAAKDKKIKYFLISYVDLFGSLRAKLAPAAAIEGMQRDGAGFAGFATWLDMSPADSDLFAKPDPASLIQLPWKPEVGWLAADLWMDGKEVTASPRKILKDQIAAAAAKGFRMKSGVECEYFLITPDGKSIADGADTQDKPCYDQQALMRRYDVITEICDCMLHLGWKPYQNDHEDANGQFEMNWEYDDVLLTADR
ncbi:MAG TPA: type III glutamate--ammonia ligase, partial [Candidatus Polarisedimenticolia bacterium]|nr:type III glutamate--ammonia ligase [Candidatus Polarisedimenticolia bacterium]